MFTGAETLLPFQRKYIEEFLDIPENLKDKKIRTPAGK